MGRYDWHEACSCAWLFLDKLNDCLEGCPERFAGFKETIDGNSRENEIKLQSPKSTGSLYRPGHPAEKSPRDEVAKLVETMLALQKERQSVWRDEAVLFL